jgi:hypothetical protein
LAFNIHPSTKRDFAEINSKEWPPWMQQQETDIDIDAMHIKKEVSSVQNDSPTKRKAKKLKDISLPVLTEFFSVTLEMI